MHRAALMYSSGLVEEPSYIQCTTMLWIDLGNMSCHAVS